MSNEEDPGRRKEWNRLNDSGQLDQMHTADMEAAAHAAKWFEGTKHLSDPEAQASMARIIKMANRGMMTMKEINSHMSELDRSYPAFEPPTSTSIDIPDHLGEQFGGL